ASAAFQGFDLARGVVRGDVPSVVIGGGHADAAQPSAAGDVVQDGRHPLVHQVAGECESGRLDAGDVSLLIVFELRQDSSALIVVDMQNDFVRVGAPLEVPDARETIDVHLVLLEWFRARRRPIVFTRFCAGPHPTLMWKWSPVLAPPTRCCWPGIKRAYDDLEGERECIAVIDELAPQSNEHQVDKHGHNGFHRTSLTNQPNAHHASTLLITGTV